MQEHSNFSRILKIKDTLMTCYFYFDGGSWSCTVHYDKGKNKKYHYFIESSKEDAIDYFENYAKRVTKKLPITPSMLKNFKNKLKVN